MRLSVTLFLLSLAGALFGGHLIGEWAVGAVIVVYSLLLGVFALFRDDGRQPVAEPTEYFRRRAA